MNIKNKLWSVALSLTLILSSTVIAHATSMETATENSYGLTDSQVMQERDQIDGGLYGDYAQRFNSLGLTFDDVKTLQNQGLSYTDILQMGSISRARLRTTRAAAPSSFARVTDVAGSIEYFHPDTGMIDGDFYSDNDGYWIEGQIENFITDVYGGIGGSYMYWLWGEWDTQYNTHQGTDQWQGAGSELLSAHKGTVYALGSTGRICIYDEYGNLQYRLLTCYYKGAYDIYASGLYYGRHFSARGLKPHSNSI